MVGLKHAAALILLALGLALLTGCEPMDGALAAQRANALATLDEANRLSTRTVQAEQAYRRATVQAGETTATAQAVALERERIRATQTVEAVYSRATVQALALQATAQAAEVTAYQTQQAAQVWTYATQQANTAELDRLRVERQQMINQLQAVFPWILGIVLAAVGIFGACAFAVAYSRRPRVIQRDGRGYAPIIYDLPTKTYYDADRNPGPVYQANPRLGPTVPISEDEHQAEVTRRAQAVHLVHDGDGGRPHALPRSITEPPAPVVTVEPPPALPPAADWSRMAAWPGQKLCLGAGTSGPVMVDPADAPHLLYAGTSGSGKSRGGLRPLAAELLADGKQVIIVDRSGLDFLPFSDHQNARVITLRDRPEQAITYLRRAYAEVLRRFEVLRAAGVSTWDRLASPDGPEVWLIMDEFSNLTDSLAAPEREECWRQARMIAAEGRKAGVHLAIALQDPTHRSIDLRIRRNMTPVCFQVKDSDASRVVLNVGGAERLSAGQFMTVQGEPVTGVAFNPSDGELTAFLAARRVPALPAPEWVEREDVVEVEAEPEDEAARIRALHKQGQSMAQIQRAIYGYTGGTAYEAVRRVILPREYDETAAEGAGA